MLGHVYVSHLLALCPSRGSFCLQAAVAGREEGLFHSSFMGGTGHRKKWGNLSRTQQQAGVASWRLTQSQPGHRLGPARGLLGKRADAGVGGRSGLGDRRRERLGTACSWSCSFHSVTPAAHSLHPQPRQGRPRASLPTQQVGKQPHGGTVVSFRPGNEEEPWLAALQKPSGLTIR